jgi:prephenate dehydrogenase
MKITIIGGGSFGQFMAQVFAPHHEVFICSRRTDAEFPGVQTIPFEGLADMDCIILAIPLDAHQSMLARLRPILRPETLVVVNFQLKE